MSKDDNLMKLDFGSGYNPQRGYATCDMTYSPYLDFVFDPIQYELSASDDFFDEIFIRNVLHHVPDFERLSQELHRVLKPKGKIVVIEPTEEAYTVNTLLDILWYRYVIPRYEVKIFSQYRKFENSCDKFFTLHQFEKVDEYKNKYVFIKEK